MPVAGQDQSDGDARLLVFNSRRGWQLGVLTTLFAFIYVAGKIADQIFALTGDGNIARPADFPVFWNAARLALDGVPLQVFEETNLMTDTGKWASAWMPWLYPPGYLMLITPLGLMSMPLAWAVMTGISFAVFALAIRPFAAGVLPVVLAVTFAPGLLPAITTGQNTLVWYAGLLAALASLRAGRPVLAGVLIGVLTLKPQLGLLIPFALIAAGHWRTVIAATITTIGVSAVPTLIYGIEYWPAWMEMTRRHGDMIFAEVQTIGLMGSSFVFWIGVGIEETLALSLQWLTIGMAALIIVVVWRSPAAGFDLKAASLLTAIPLSSPYFWFYEAAVLAIATLFMIRAGVLGPRPLNLLFLAMLWLGAGPTMVIESVYPDALNTTRMLIAPLSVTALTLCLITLARLRALQPAAP